MRAVVSGAGIAGLTFGLCMQRAGHEVTIIERSPQLRDAGYMMDFFGPGYDAAEALGLLPEVEKIHYPIGRLTFLETDGEPKYTLSYDEFQELFDGRHFNFMRGDLERLLYEVLPDRSTIKFGRTIARVDQREDGVRVTLDDGKALEADILVGADGIHSNVRGLVFGPEADYERYLGYHTFAFILDDPGLRRETEDQFSTLTTPGRQVAIYPIHEGRVATFFVHEDDAPPPDHSKDRALEELRDRYGDLDWVVPRLIRRAEALPGLYFDAVSQIEVPRWSKGRAVLVGDAAYCVPLLAGQGAGMAILGAALLAAELDGHPDDPAEAFAPYEGRMRPYTDVRQEAGRDFADMFVPGSKLKLLFRDTVMRYSAWPPMSWIVKQDIAGGGMDPEDWRILSSLQR